MLTRRESPINPRGPRAPGTGRLRFIEVQGRAAGSATVTITKNEILTALNEPDDFLLALVIVDDTMLPDILYIRSPSGREPDSGVTSVNDDLDGLPSKAEKPA
jgi:hypothetical protein